MPSRAHNLRSGPKPKHSYYNHSHNLRPRLFKQRRARVGGVGAVSESHKFRVHSRLWGKITLGANGRISKCEWFGHAQQDKSPSVQVQFNDQGACTSSHRAFMRHLQCAFEAVCVLHQGEEVAKLLYGIAIPQDMVFFHGPRISRVAMHKGRLLGEVFQQLCSSTCKTENGTDIYRAEPGSALLWKARQSPTTANGTFAYELSLL